MDKHKMIEICVVKSYEGVCISIDDFRICGGKPAGLNNILHKWQVPIEDFDRIDALRNTRTPRVDEDAMEKCINDYHDSKPLMCNKYNDVIIKELAKAIIELLNGIKKTAP